MVSVISKHTTPHKQIKIPIPMRVKSLSTLFHSTKNSIQIYKGNSSTTGPWRNWWIPLTIPTMWTYLKAFRSSYKRFAVSSGLHHTRICWNFLNYPPCRQDVKLLYRFAYMYRLVINHIDFPDAPIHSTDLLLLTVAENGSPLALELHHCHTSKFLNSFFPRTSTPWNSLSADTVTSTSLVSFKHALTLLFLSISESSCS